MCTTIDTQNMIDIRLGNNKELIESIEDKTIELCVTSPPYKNCDGFNLKEQKNIFANIYRCLKNDSLFYLNFGALVEDKFRPFSVCAAALECGFKLNDTVIWEKPQYSPIQGAKRLNNLYEFVFILYKGKMPKIDRLSIGIEYKDKSNIGRYSDIDLKCRGNVWRVPYETINSKSQKLHPDRMPLALAEMCIKLSGIREGTVLDPYGGSGTTALAAKNLNLSCITFERNEAHFSTIKERLK